MTQHHYHNIHQQFKLNRKHFNFKTLANEATRLTIEGAVFEKEIGTFLLDWLNDKDHVMANTSGSSGSPKVIKLQKQAMVNSALATGAFFNLQASQTALLCLPVNYIAGKMMLVRAMVLGLEIDCIDPKIALEINNTYSFCAMIPMQVQQNIKKLKVIDTLIIGGASVSQRIISDLQTLKTKAFETYGMTETITHIAIKKINNIVFQNPKKHFETLPNINITLDKRDCLVIDAPELTAQKIITNDVVKLHSKTEFEWLGRYDNIINSGGIKLNPEQIEIKLKACLESRFFIASEDDKIFGECLILVVETEESIAVISAKLKELSSLKKYEKPKKIYILNQFLETTSGKIQRKETLKQIRK